MKHFLLLLFSLIALNLSAIEITAEKAKELANVFFQTNHPQKLSASFQMVFDGETAHTRAAGAAPALYVFDNINGKGFVIVSGDDITTPILGYSFENEFPQENIPININGWLDNLKSQINHAREMGLTSKHSRATDKLGETVVKLETPIWDQMAPFNNECPKINNKETPTGCVITATAIAMRYHQWPPKGKGVAPQYKTATTGTYVNARSLQHDYHWDKMKYDYRNGNYSDEEAKHVAELMADLGVLFKADYHPNGTGAVMHNIMAGLSEYMDYDKSGIYLRRTDNNETEWYKMLKNELNNNRPIIYDGNNNSVGHAFILDGYTSTDYFSVNWGWGSYCNGYFRLDAMVPDGSGTGGNNSHYNNNQGAVFNLKKNEGGEYVELFQYREDSNGVTGLTILENNLDINKTIKIAVSWIGNTGHSTINGQFMIGLVDKKGNLKEELLTFPIEGLGPNLGWSFDQLLTINSTIKIGDRICCLYKSERYPEWNLIKGGEKCSWEILIGNEKPLEESTQLRYNKIEKKLYISTKEGVSVKMFHNDSELNVIQQITDTEYSIPTEGLTSVKLVLDKDEEHQEIKLKLNKQ